MKQNQTLISAGVVILLLIGGWWLYNSNGPAMPTPQGNEKEDVAAETPAPQGPVAPAEGESVTVADQPAGMAVVVSTVNLSQMGWIAVKDDHGWILGAGRFDAGTSKDVSVPLLRGTEPGERYQVLLYIDEGDKEFDFRKDSLVIESGGSVAGTMFNAQ